METQEIQNLVTDNNSNLQNISFKILPNGSNCYVVSTNRAYRWDETSEAIPDNNNVIIPNGNPLKGRWLLYNNIINAETVIIIDNPDQIQPEYSNCIVVFKNLGEYQTSTTITFNDCVVYGFNSKLINIGTNPTFILNNTCKVIGVEFILGVAIQLNQSGFPNKTYFSLIECIFLQCTQAIKLGVLEISSAILSLERNRYLSCNRGLSLNWQNGGFTFIISNAEYYQCTSNGIELLKTAGGASGIGYLLISNSFIQSSSSNCILINNHKIDDSLFLVESVLEGPSNGIRFEGNEYVNINISKNTFRSAIGVSLPNLVVGKPKPKIMDNIYSGTPSNPALSTTAAIQRGNQTIVGVLLSETPITV